MTIRNIEKNTQTERTTDGYKRMTDRKKDEMVQFV